jgi:hypothetical protein
MLDTPADVIAADKAALSALGGDRSALGGGRAYSESLATTTGAGANSRSGTQRPTSAGAESDEEARFQLLRRATNAAGAGGGGGEVAIDPMRLFQSRRAVGGPAAAAAVEMTSSQRGPTQRKFE